MAHRAEMGATAGDASFNDGGATAGTGLTNASKNSGKREVAAALAFGIDVIFVGGAAFFYR